MGPFSIYVHIPYCLRRCPYCDFNTYALTSIPEREYVSALLSELDYRAMLPEWRSRPVATVYFGGGTPSLFSPLSIGRIMKGIGERFQFAPQLEVSLEANPGSISPDTLEGFFAAGVNRLSLGGQSFQDDLLKRLGRLHNAEQVAMAVEVAKSAGFTNLSVDLMFGVPSQTIEQQRQDIERAQSLGIQHVSAYGLTIEKGTPFYTDFKKGQLKLPDEDTVVAMMEQLYSLLPEGGFDRYEISNFAKSGYEARHNLVYWNGGDYLGLGAGAHSFYACWEGHQRRSGVRWANFALPNKFIREAVAFGQAEGWRETLSVQDLMFEFFFLGLRKAEGVRFSQFEHWFESPVEQTYPDLLTVLYDQGIIARDGDFLALTRKGLLVADSVIEHFAQTEAVQKPEPARRAAANG